MDERGRRGFSEMVMARIAEWQKNTANIANKMARSKDDPEVKRMVEEMKSKLPPLEEKAKVAVDVPDEKWPDFKSEVDLTFESLLSLQKTVLQRLGGA